jgi:hypothetical protein
MTAVLPFPRNRFRQVRAGVALTAAVLLAVTGCANPEASAGGSEGGGQVVKTDAPSGPTCTAEQYGAGPIDLTTAVVGFSQSEKEAHPFRIAETRSIRDEAEKVGVGRLLVTIDRELGSAEACRDYLTFIGSDFVEQGKRAGELMNEVTGGEAKVAILLGASGNNQSGAFTANMKPSSAAPC